MLFNTRNNDQLLLQHPPLGINSYGRRALNYTAPTVWNKLPDDICNVPSVMSFRKQLQTHYFEILPIPPVGCVMSFPEVS